VLRIVPVANWFRQVSIKRLSCQGERLTITFSYNLGNSIQALRVLVDDRRMSTTTMEIESKTLKYCTIRPLVATRELLMIGPRIFLNANPNWATRRLKICRKEVVCASRVYTYDPHWREKLGRRLLMFMLIGRPVLPHHRIHIFHNGLEKRGWNAGTTQLKGWDPFQGSNRVELNE
jgi:hypothetical protein